MQGILRHTAFYLSSTGLMAISVKESTNPYVMFAVVILYWITYFNGVIEETQKQRCDEVN